MVSTQKLNGTVFAQLVQAGAANLQVHAQTVNDLNVFPIPDGDTGSNMLLTIIGGVDAAKHGSVHLGDTARLISDGMLLSARGNSGVILSQIFDGLAEGFSGLEEADYDACIHALREGVRHCYDAVMKPTEGTMLTVMRCATEQVERKASADTQTLLTDFLDASKQTLEQTPDMLPVLKKAGVVDSGGAGLVYIMEGMLRALKGETEPAEFAAPMQSEQQLDVSLFTEDSVLEFGYCTELLLRLQRCKTDLSSFDIRTLTEQLKQLGDSVVAVKTGTIVKLHIHTMTPDKVLAFCQRYGEFLKIKIENMSLQHSNTVAAEESPAQRKAYGVVAVASGAGVQQLFTDRGADVIVDGGQCMNPSTEDFIAAFRKVNADTIFVLPNNSNILLTAKQAAQMYPQSDVRVLESKTIGEGYAALSMYSTDSGDTEQILRELQGAMEGVVTAEVSQCVRDTQEAASGDYIGFVGKSILASNTDRYLAACATVDVLEMARRDICILIYGKQANEAEAEKLSQYILGRYPGKEVYVIGGMQEIYDYILILE